MCLMMDQSLLENVEEYVLEENKLVTYKWLSKQLEIHVNVAKQLLGVFAGKHSGAGLNVTYLLAGVTKESNGTNTHNVALVSEDAVEEAKQKLSSITSQHIYSIQKAKLKDSNALYATDQESSVPSQFGAIRCSVAKPRSTAEVLAKRQAVNPVVEQQPPQQAKSKKPAEKDSNKKEKDDKVKKEKEESKNKKEKDESRSEVKEESAEKPTSSEKAKPAQKGTKGSALASMFANQAKKPPKKKETQSEDNVSPKQSKGMSAFLSKQSPTKEKSDKATSSSKHESESPAKEQPPTKKQKVEKKQQPKKKNQNRKRAGKSPEKKRRRIQAVSDSESSDEDASSEEEEAPPPMEEDEPPVATAFASDDEDVVPATPQQSNGKRRSKKWVDKSFVDEEGFMVTKKVQESCSEDEEEVKKEISPKKEEKPSKQATPTKKAISPQKTKQASIMSFFKKK